MLHARYTSAACREVESHAGGPREAELVIVNAVPGKPVAASDEGLLAADPTQLKLLQRAGTIRWQLRLAPAETRVITYRYERYVPSI